MRFLRDALRARTLGADAGYDAAVDGLRETPRAAVKGLASRCNFCRALAWVESASSGSAILNKMREGVAWTRTTKRRRRTT